MGQTQLVCGRCTGLGEPGWRRAEDKLEGNNHTYHYGYFGFDRTSLSYGVRITKIYTFAFQGEATRSDTSAGVVNTFLAPLDEYFGDQAPHPPAVNRSSKLLESQNAIMGMETGHSLTDAKVGPVTKEGDLEKIVRNGVALCVENDVDGTTAAIKAYSNNSSYPPVMWADYEPVELKVKSAAVRDTKKIVQGFTYSFDFETEYDAKCVLGEVKQRSAWVGYEFGPQSSANVHDIGTRTGEFFTVPRAAGPGDLGPYTPWVYVVSNGGQQSGTVYAECSVEPLSITLTDVHPNTTQYAGLPVKFDWEYQYSMPAGASGGSAVQLKAELHWRQKGMDDDHVIGGIGAAMNKTVTGLPPGTIEYKIVSWDSSGGVTDSGWKSFENKALVVKADDLYPAEGARAPKNADNRFGWRVVPDEDPEFPGILTVQSATFYWRPTGGGTATAINAGTANELTVPAGTFARYDSIDWRVTLTASTGGTATSEWITVSTQDALSKPVTLSPVGDYVQDDPAGGILFTWLHQLETGTRQTGWLLQYSADSVVYTTLGEGGGAGAQYRAAYNTLPLGTVYWRVRTKNTDGEAGAWSDPATIVVQRAPQTPRITGADGQPRPTITWQAQDQEGYRVTIGDFDTGWIAGTDSAYTHGDILPDGEYDAAVYIMTPTGQESAPAKISLLVQNRPFPAPQLHLTERDSAVRLQWTAVEGAVYYVLRDGTPILRTGETAAWDWCASGRHTYVVRAMKDGYYADSKPLPGMSRVENAVFSALDPVRWVPLSLKRGDRPGHDENAAGQVDFRHFYGRALPVAYDSGFLDAGNSQTWTLPEADAADYDRLRGLVGRPAVYKDCFGRVRFGVLTGVDGGLTEEVELSLSFTQTDYEERVSYA